MDALNVRDLFVPKALGDTAKGADKKSQKFKRRNYIKNKPTKQDTT